MTYNQVTLKALVPVRWPKLSNYETVYNLDEWQLCKSNDHKQNLINNSI